MKMRKMFLSLSLIVLCGAMNLFAVYSENFPITVSQPDGTELVCYITGDEYYNWLHDADGYTIVRDSETGYLVYAQLENDILIATRYVVGVDDPKKTELTPWINISVEKRTELRKAFLENTPEKPVLKETNPNQKANQGTMNNLVVYIRFNDQEEFSQDTTHYWTMFNSMETAETSSLRNYFKQVSYNKIDIVSHFYPVPTDNIILSYQDQYDRSYYMPYNSVTNPDGYQDYDERTLREQVLVIRAINHIKPQIPIMLDLDFNRDMLVDNICFIIKGEPTEWNTLLWPHRWVLFIDNIYIETTYHPMVWSYNFLLESHLDIQQASVISHETFHSLDAPDLYRYEDRTITPIGKWDLMASNTNPPQSTAAYMKYEYGKWIDQIPEITTDGEYTIYPVWHDSNNIYKIPSPNSVDEYFTVEFRDNSIFWDQNIPGSGLLIYRIFPSLNGNSIGPLDEMYIFRPDEDYPNVDGRIEDAHFSADVGRTIFNATSNPACVLSDGSPGGIEIYDISSVGEYMTFKVRILKKPEADFSADAQAVLPGTQVGFHDHSLNSPKAWKWEFEGGTPPTSNEQNPIVRFDTKGSYSVELTVTNESGSSSVIKENFILVGEPPITNFEADKVAVSMSESVRFKDLSQNDPSEWEWQFQGGTPEISTMKNPTVSYSNHGTFTVTLTATNEFGSDTKTITDYITVSPVSIKEIGEVKISVYPNPNADGFFVLDCENIPLGSTIQVYDVLGHNILADILHQKSMNIDLMNYPSGIYFLKITNENHSYDMKLIKQ